LQNAIDFILGDSHAHGGSNNQSVHSPQSNDAPSYPSSDSNIRSPIAAREERLADTPFDNILGRFPLGMFGIAPEMLPQIQMPRMSSVFDDVPSRSESLPLSDQGGASSRPQSVQGKPQRTSVALPGNGKRPSSKGTLGSIMNPHLHLIHPGSLEDAIMTGQREMKWIIVNIQSNSEFDCWRFNRDTLSDESVQAIISSNFIFWQAPVEMESGITVVSSFDGNVVSRDMRMNPFAMQFLEKYQFPNLFPLVALIDPRTKELVFSHTGFMSAEMFIDRFTTFDMNHSLNSDEVIEQIHTASNDLKKAKIPFGPGKRSLSGSSGAVRTTSSTPSDTISPSIIPTAPSVDIDLDGEMYMDEDDMLARAIEASLKHQKSEDVVDITSPSSTAHNKPNIGEVVSIEDDENDEVVLYDDDFESPIHVSSAPIISSSSTPAPKRVYPIDPPPSVLPVEPSGSGNQQGASDDVTRVQFRFPDGSKLVRFVYLNEPVAALYYYAAHKLQKGHVAASFYTAFLAARVDSIHDKQEPYFQGDKVTEMIVERFGEKVADTWEIVLSNVSVVTVLGPDMYGKTIFEAGLNRATLIVRFTA
jgi:Thioredoxin-like